MSVCYDDIVPFRFWKLLDDFLICVVGNLVMSPSIYKEITNVININWQRTRHPEIGTTKTNKQYFFYRSACMSLNGATRNLL